MAKPDKQSFRYMVHCAEARMSRFRIEAFVDYLKQHDIVTITPDTVSEYLSETYGVDEEDTIFKGDKW